MANTDAHLVATEVTTHVQNGEPRKVFLNTLNLARKLRARLSGAICPALKTKRDMKQ